MSIDSPISPVASERQEIASSLKVTIEHGDEKVRCYPQNVAKAIRDIFCDGATLPDELCYEAQGVAKVMFGEVVDELLLHGDLEEIEGLYLKKHLSGSDVNGEVVDLYLSVYFTE